MERNAELGFSVEVVQCWKGQPLDVELLTLDRPRRIAIGEAGRFLLPIGTSFDLVVVDESGRAMVSVPASATALVSEGESTREIGADATDRVLVVGAQTSIEVAIADMTFFVRPVAKEKEKFAAPLFDGTGARWIAAAFAFHAALLMTFFLMPPDASALSNDLTGEQARYIQVHLDAMQVTPPPPAPVTGGDASDSDATSSAPASADGGGESPVPAVSGGPGRPHRAPQTILAPTRETIEGLSTFSQLSQVFASMDGDDSPFMTGNLRDAGPGGPGDALIPGGLFGPGPGGLHMTQGHGTCIGDHCGEGTIDQGGLDTHGGRHVGPGPSLTDRAPHETTPEIHMCAASDPSCGRSVGGLTREQIRSVIARHRNEVRFCYEQALVGHPELEGRVTVGFQIAQDGHVATSQAQGLAGVDGCVAQAVQRWHFPASASPTAVSYPFVLESSAAE